MPSFSFLKASKRGSQHLEVNGQTSQDPSGSNDHEPTATEKAQRRKSTREFFRALIKKTGEPDDSKTSRWRNSSMKKSQPLQLKPTHSPEQPLSPMSDTNKPLPPPPPREPSSPPVIEGPPSPKPVTKLARIISPIAEPDLHKLFFGAPQFFARSEGHHAGAPHPSTAFPWNTEVEIRDLSDHVRIRDEAWGCVTALPHITVLAKRESRLRKHRAHFEPRCYERPNMLSMQGIERGTIGYAAALELGVADCLNTPAEGPDRDPQLVSETRRRFLSEKTGLRPLTDSVLIEQLMEVSTNYHEDPTKHNRPTVELYTELFTQILYPPSRVTDSQDPYSLQVQIEALINVLTEPLIWFDFSIVEWRMRLGQILWGLSLDSELGDEISVNNEISHEPGTQKYWLLLQILLSSELLLRLDAVALNIDQGIEELNPTELRRFDKSATTSVKWSMILARRWLENIRIEKPDLEAAAAEKKSATGWLATLTGTTEEAPKIVESVEHLNFEGIYKTQQLTGLLHFAGNIGWPNLDSLSAKVATNGIKVSNNTLNTPFAATPLSMTSQNSAGYFASRRSTGNLSTSVQKNMSAMLQPAGWLSSSYINGLVLPGEGLSHFLIATLLENDEAAVAKLGDEANLFGGFVYSGRSFWSTGCIVGRVLAARKGAKECMGWISSDVIPLGTSEAWVDIDVESSVHDVLRKTEKPRLWNKSLIETRGSVLGGADPSSILTGDFVVPSDESTQKPLSVVFESLDLFSSVDSEVNSITETPGTETTELNAPGIKTYSAMMRFALQIDGKGKKEVNLALSHDVHFVTAHPCVSSPFLDILRTPTSPSFHDHEHGEMDADSISAGHPLHKAFTFTRTPILSLVSKSSSTDFSELLEPPLSPDPTRSSSHTTSSSIPKVLIIDCTDSGYDQFPSRPGVSPSTGHKHDFGSDLEMMGRALCAERGWNALVSRRGRGCVGCAVREAGAVGWRVVLRVA